MAGKGKVDDALKFLEEVYGLRSRVVNEYHVRLYREEDEKWYDWYWTKGTLLYSSTLRVGKSKDAEEIALLIAEFDRKQRGVIIGTLVNKNVKMEQKKLYSVDLETKNGKFILTVLQADSMDEALQKAREKAPGMLVTSVSEHTRTLI